ncbi:MAG: pyruvate kinase [Acidobacteria bacterium]|nr:pyruvate kinase [Acidobacteriota bacterium]
MQRRAKIVATIGPASSNPKTLARLIRAGVNVVRLNQSHGTREEHRRLIRLVRQVSEEAGRSVGVMVDLMGPRHRLDHFEGARMLKDGDIVSLGAGAGADLALDRDMVRHVQPGEQILIDDGRVQLEVRSKDEEVIRAEVIVGGAVSSRKGVNLPDSHLPFRISDKDLADIRMAVEEDADFLAASYIGSSADVVRVREAAVQAGRALPVIAKLERRRALENLDEIVLESDGVMVARGDLGVEIPLHQVPVEQKRIIESGWRLARPVIVATQMLESMIEHPRPTRAESSDVANAVFDGADAMMLSGESAAGRYPLEAVQTMHRIIAESERYQLSKHTSQPVGFHTMEVGPYDIEPPNRLGALEIPETVSAAAILSARHLSAQGIVVLSQGGFTARQVACRRPSTPVLAFTREPRSMRELQLVWGVHSVRMDQEVYHHDEVVAMVDRQLLAGNLALPGDTIVLLMGDPIQDRPPTNLVRIHRVRPQ